MEINRNTLWLWEAGRIQPAEKKIRLLAKALDISVDKISDLQPEILKANESDIEQRNTISSWISFSDKTLLDKKEHHVSTLKFLEAQFNRVYQLETIICSLINFSDVMLYVKDTSQNYLSASKAFISLVSCDSEQSIIGKTDKDLFPQKEAKANSDEDEQVLLTGNAIKNKEDEYKSDCLKHFINKLNKEVWLCTGQIINDNQITRKNFLYASKNDFCKKFFLQGSGLPLDEQIAYFYSLRIEKPSHDLKALKEKGYSAVKFKIKVPDAGEIVCIKDSVFYDSTLDLCFGIVERDEVKDAEERIKNNVINKLRKLKVDDTIIDTLFD